MSEFVWQGHAGDMVLWHPLHDTPQLKVVKNSLNYKGIFAIPVYHSACLSLYLCKPYLIGDKKRVFYFSPPLFAQHIWSWIFFTKHSALLPHDTQHAIIFYLKGIHCSQALTTLSVWPDTTECLLHVPSLLKCSPCGLFLKEPGDYVLLSEAALYNVTVHVVNLQANVSTKLHTGCVILGFRREVHENCVLGFYAANNGNSSPTFRNKLSDPFQGSRIHI